MHKHVNIKQKKPNKDITWQNWKYTTVLHISHSHRIENKWKFFSWSF